MRSREFDATALYQVMHMFQDFPASNATYAVRKNKNKKRAVLYIVYAYSA